MAKMTKTKLRELLADVRIFNTWDFVGHGGLYITRRPSEARACTVPAWVIHRRGYKTDPDAGWYNYGCKTFYVSGQAAAADALMKAKAWAGAKYLIADWVIGPFGEWMGKALYDRRMEELLG